MTTCAQVAGRMSAVPPSAAPRSDSREPAQVGRKRSNTVQSLYKNPPSIPSIPALPLKLGDTKVLTTWVHDPKDSTAIILNRSWWPGVVEGDMFRLTPHSSQSHTSSSAQETAGMVFVASNEEIQKHQLQVSSFHLATLHASSMTYTSGICAQACCREVWNEEQRRSPTH